MNEINWSVVLQIVIAGGIIWILKGVARINGSIGKLWEWSRGHEALNKKSEETTEKNITALWQKVDPK